MARTYYVYILANRSRTLYIGITNNIYRRIAEHRSRTTPGFTRQYMVRRLVHVEAYPTARDAIIREKQLKGWRRSRKIALIEQENREWIDLAAEWALCQDDEDPSLRSG